MVILPEFKTIPAAVAIDLDGTFFRTDLTVSRRNREALERCLALGLPVIIATSRSERSTRSLLGKELAERCSLVTLNGTKIIGTAPLSGFRRIAIPPQIAERVVGLISAIEPEARITVEIEGFEFGSNKNPDPETLWRINAATPDMVLSIEEAVARAPSKIAVSANGRDVSAIAQGLSEKFGNYISVVPSDGMKFLNIPPVGASKPAALRYLLGPHGIELDSVLAFGDDIPDLSMLSACGFSVAMANAVEEVKAAAGYHTAANDDDGVAIVIEKMLERA
ncbi:MAG: HAD-IIB family hydrolase [Dehalococcoidales bacterium]|nr:HAD-IIB family hydrolase [Dehalococcoidales bacterium]